MFFSQARQNVPYACEGSTDSLYKQMVQESIIEELTGRAGKTETRKRCAKGYRMETLYRECVLKLDFELP